MRLNTLEIAMIKRADSDSYNIRMNPATLELLSLIFEFKLATAWQISRFLEQKDRSGYIYRKLHRLWRADLLESFKVFTGSRVGMPVYYILSRNGLKILADNGKYDAAKLRNYPRAALFARGVFKHEAEIVELASLESMHSSNSLRISFKGESSSVVYDLRSSNNIEVLTPDYTVYLTVGKNQECVYSEFERTAKSKLAMEKKIERYIRYLNPEQCRHTTIRLFFQTPNMEQSFWLNMISNKPGFLKRLRIFTTNLILLNSHEQFLEPIYATENSIKLIKHGYLTASIQERVKLFSFL